MVVAQPRRSRTLRFVGVGDDSADYNARVKELTFGPVRVFSVAER